MINYEHPEFLSYGEEWRKWRLTYQGGRPFVVEYLQKHSTRETDADYIARRDATYCPWHAGAALTKVKNSIYQRMPDIVRMSPSESYNKAIAGDQGGVDNLGSSMNYFLGCEILPELLVMGKVGVYVDMPTLIDQPTMFGTQNSRPYLYRYTREQIINWTTDGIGRLTSLLLCDTRYKCDEIFGFPIDYLTNYRYYKLTSQGVLVSIVDNNMKELEAPILLKLNKIPFVIFELNESLLKNIADYQIALLNIESSDIAYINRANFTFYVEQFDPNVEAMLMNMNRNNTDADGTALQANAAANNTIEIGVAKGRRYPKGIEAPQFITPSTEPLKASMEKQEAMKSDILKLLNLSLANIKSNRSSAESKQQDQSDEECGLSYIGLEMEAGERSIVDIWQQYEAIKDSGHIKYPETYEIYSFQESLGMSEKLATLIPFMPSTTGRKAMANMLVKTILGGRVPSTDYDAIKSEIETAKAVISDPSTISKDVEDGLCTKELGSELKGYPPGEAERAKDEHATRLALIAAAQGGNGIVNPAARGLPDLAVDKKEADVEKVGKEGRGEAQ